MTVRFCQDHGLNHECVSITSGHFVELLSRIEESVEIKINCNKLRVEDLKNIVKVMVACQGSIAQYQDRLEGNNRLIDTFKEELKGIKKSVKTLNEGLENLSKDVEAEEKVNEGLKASVEKLEEKYKDIKEASFDEHGRVIALIKAITPEERFAFSKPLIVHEDIEKVSTILMILLKMDVFGWKPFKDKFLSDNWPQRLVELDPDQCKHKQVFIINKKLKDIKTPKADLRTLSPISAMFWDFIEGVLKAFTTEFERSKLSREIEKMQGKLDTSASRLAGLRAEEDGKKRNIEEQNLEYGRKTKECDLKETETADLMKLLQHEQKFVNTSAFFASHCSVQKEELQVDESEALQEAIIQETVGTYFGAFDTQQREELLKSTKHIVKDLSNRSLTEVEFLQAFDLLAIDSDLTDNMEKLTKKRMLFCQDPNDLVTLSLEREGEEGKRSIKLYDKDDIETIKGYLKDESCSCILVEDAYFENTNIMNFLLDDSLDELCLMAQQCDKFIFIITKVDSYCLPHKAYSKLYFINLKLSYVEVLHNLSIPFTSL
jgi:predicted  nucleic acid-binding Zn-ribbon protein